MAQVQLFANQHGNEVVGRELLLHMIAAICEAHVDDIDDGSDPVIAPYISSVLASVDLHIMPSLNPDGAEVSYHAGACANGVCVHADEDSVVGRRNAEDLDLNRNFYDQYFKGVPTVAHEARLYIEWVKSNRFVLSLNLHGGPLVASYPYDSSKTE